MEAAHMLEAVRSAVPEHAKLAPLEFQGVCEIAAGYRWPNGEPAGGSRLHPQGYCTDPFVELRDGRWRMVFNSPINAGGRWPTAIAECSSANGLYWTVPKHILRPDPEGTARPVQYETPARMDGGALMAVLTYQYDGNFNREDSITFWMHGQKVGAPITPTLPEEQVYRDPKGKTQGGCQEPSILGMYGPWLLVAYLGVTYANGRKPSLLLAGTIDGGKSWYKWPHPLFQDPDSDTGVGSPQVYRDPRGGFHLLYQRRRGNRFEVRHAWSMDLTNWHQSGAVISNAAGDWRGRITAPCGFVDKDGRHHVWAFGSPVEGQTKAPFDFGYWRSA